MYDAKGAKVTMRHAHRTGTTGTVVPVLRSTSTLALPVDVELLHTTYYWYKYYPSRKLYRKAERIVGLAVRRKKIMSKVLEYCLCFVVAA